MELIQNDAHNDTFIHNNHDTIIANQLLFSRDKNLVQLQENENFLLQTYHLHHDTRRVDEIKEGDPCDDGKFCNGSEFYDVNLICLSGFDMPYTACNTICDEYYQMCFEEVVECQSGIFTSSTWNENI